MPPISPPPPTGTSTASRSGTCSASSRPIVPWPAMTRGSSKGWTKTSPRSASISPRGHRPRRSSLRAGRPRRRAAAPRDLVSGAQRRHGDDRGDAEAGRVEGHGEAVVARARRHDAAASLGGVELEQDIGGAALLEGARHLEVLELDEDARAGHARQRLRVGAGGDVDDRRRGGRAPPARRRGSRSGDQKGSTARSWPAEHEAHRHERGGVRPAPAGPAQSIRMSPPWPRPSSTRTLMASCAACTGSLDGP